MKSIGQARRLLVIAAILSAGGMGFTASLFAAEPSAEFRVTVATDKAIYDVNDVVTVDVRAENPLGQAMLIKGVLANSLGKQFGTCHI